MDDDDDDDDINPPPLFGGDDDVGNNILHHHHGHHDDIPYDDVVDDDIIDIIPYRAAAAQPSNGQLNRIIGGIDGVNAPLMADAPMMPPILLQQQLLRLLPEAVDVAHPRRLALPLLPQNIGNIGFNLIHWEGGGGGVNIINDDDLYIGNNDNNNNNNNFGLRHQRVIPMGRFFHPRNNLLPLQLMVGGGEGGRRNQIMQGHAQVLRRNIAAVQQQPIEDAEIAVAAAVAEILNEHHNNIPDPNAFDINTTFVYRGPPNIILNNNNTGSGTTTPLLNPPIPQNVQYIQIDTCVTIIPENAFLHEHNLTCVIMHDNITEIGPYAFSHCSKLVNIVIPKNTHTICQYAFAYCEQLTSVIFSGEEDVVTVVDVVVNNNNNDDIDDDNDERKDTENEEGDGGGDGGRGGGGKEGGSMLCTIGEMAFARCYSLQTIILPRGIRTIGIAAFKCTPLHTFVIGGGGGGGGGDDGGSNSYGVLSNIDDETFYDSYSQSPVEALTILTQEKDDQERGEEVDITTIGDAAFANNRYTNFRLPPLISVMSPCLFRNCQSLFSMEVPRGVEHYGSQTLAWCPYLRNVTISHTAIIDEGVFFGCTDLQHIFGSNEHKIIFALRHRFDDLPDHENLYYRSYRDQCQCSTDCDINVGCGGGVSGGNTTYHKQDCLGMTQLHILACSSPTTTMKSLDKTLELYHFLVKKHPQALITEDKWGTVPIQYAIWGGAPKDVIQFLVDSYKLHHPGYVFDWTAMVDLLLRANAPMDRIHNISNINESYYPDYPIDWDSLLDSDTAPFDRAVDHSGYFLNRFCYLVSRGLTKRINAISVRQWREYMLDLLEKAPFRYNKQNNYFILDAIRTKLVHFEGRSQELNAACYLLEVALWKKKLFEAGEEDRELLTDACEQMKIDGSFNFREHCRISCGAGIIIGHVLPYLMHSTVDDELRSSSEHVE